MVASSRSRARPFSPIPSRRLEPCPFSPPASAQIRGSVPAMERFRSGMTAQEQFQIRAAAPRRPHPLTPGTTSRPRPLRRQWFRYKARTTYLTGIQSWTTYISVDGEQNQHLLLATISMSWVRKERLFFRARLKRSSPSPFNTIGDSSMSEQVSDAGDLCSDAVVVKFIVGVTIQLWRSNALMVANAILVAIMVAAGASGRRYRYAAVTRFLFQGASTLYLPIVAYVASSIGK